MKTTMIIVCLALAALPILHGIKRVVFRRIAAAMRASAARRKAAERAEAAALKAAEAEQRRAEQAAKRQAELDARVNAARLIAEYEERAARARATAAEPVREPAAEVGGVHSTPIADAAEPVSEPAAETAAEPVKALGDWRRDGNREFCGEVVSFTGAIPGMTRKEAMTLVEKNGGRAFANMPAGTTILVVGDKPGAAKLNKADQWIGQCRKMSAEEFAARTRQPLSFEPDEFMQALSETDAA